jgi:membrane protease YdiL (CAAX protease family)
VSIAGTRDTAFSSPFFAIAAAAVGAGLHLFWIATPLQTAGFSIFCAAITGLVVAVRRESVTSASLAWSATATVGLVFAINRPLLIAAIDIFGDQTPISRMLLTGPGRGLLGQLLPAILVILVGRLLFGLSLREQWSGIIAVTQRALFLGLAAGLALAALTLSAAAASGVTFAPHLNLVDIVSNVFSNLYEEVFYRGLLLVVVARAFGPVTAVIWTSVAFGIGHGLNEKGAFIALTSGLLAFAVIRAKSLWAGWAGHQIADMIVDSMLPSGS